MITDLHKFSTKIVKPLSKKEYRQHMCGLCNSLGVNYGIKARLLTSYDFTLFSILLNSQNQYEPDVEVKRCPILYRKVETIGSYENLSATIAILLSQISLFDHLKDNKRYRIPLLVSKLAFRADFQHALNKIEQFGIDRSTFTEMVHVQSEIEENHQAVDPFEPTAQLCEKLFELLAKVSSVPENLDPLRKIGRAYGKYIYLLDAFMDFPKDVIDNQYNPLRTYSFSDNKYLTLHIEGLTWLNNHLLDCFSEIKANLSKLTIKRYSDLLEILLLQPLTQVNDLITGEIQKGQGLLFHRWQLADTIKASLFIIPVITIPAALYGLPDSIHIPQNISNEVVNTFNDCAHQSHHLSMHDLIGGPNWLSNLLSSQHNLGSCWDPCAYGYAACFKGCGCCITQNNSFSNSDPSSNGVCANISNFCLDLCPYGMT